MPPAAGVRVLGEPTFLVLGLCAVAAVYAWFTRFGFDVLEEGYFAWIARRVQLGQLPYRDFSAPYTPGIFYLDARVFDVFGNSIVALRGVQVGVHLILLLAVYLTARQLVPPRVAMLPPLLTAAMSAVPELWSLHPGWLSAAATMVGVLAVARYLATGRAGYVLGAGFAYGVAFAFKQNLGLFGLLATIWFLVVAERHLRQPDAPSPRSLGRVRVGLQIGAILALPLAGVVLMRTAWTLTMLGLLLVPLFALSAASFWVLIRPTLGAPPAGRSNELRFYGRPALVVVGFAVVTIPWLIALVGALDGRLGLLSSFVGAVDPAAFFMPPPLPTLVQIVLLAASLLGPGLVVLAARRWPARSRQLLLASVAYGVALLSIAIATSGGLDAPHAAWAAGAPAWAWYAGTGVVGGSSALCLLLPSLVFWGGLGRFVWQGRLTQPRFTPRQLVQLWYLIAGSVLLLHLYPRMDAEHLVWCAGPLLALGADVAWSSRQLLARAIEPAMPDRRCRLAYALALVAIPARCVALQVRDRLAGVPGFVLALSGAQGRSLMVLEPPVAGGPVWVWHADGQMLEQLVGWLDQHTRPGEPIFAYPAIPGVYYLADRPNPTRLDHLLTGMASPQDQQAVVRELGQVRVVVWDAGGVGQDLKPTDNAAIVDYVQTNFHVDHVDGLYTVLVRNGLTASDLPQP